MKYKIVVILFFFLSGCRKEGLSKDTGNVEITTPAAYQVTWDYYLYTYEEFQHYINAEPSIATRSGRSFTGLINEKGLKEGVYGIHVFQNGTGYQRNFSIEAGKVTKLNVP
jgi:hypothetical protein